MKYKAIVFDIDGTLLDTARMNILPLMEILKKETGKSYAYDELTHLLGNSGTVTLKQMGIPEEDNHRVLQEWIECIQKSGIVSIPFDGVFDVLEELKKQQITLGIVSSKEQKQYQFDMVGNHMDHYFTAVVLADDTELHKPHPEPILACLKKLNLKAKDILYVGDSDADGMCSAACGCDFAYAAWGPLALSVDCTYHLEKPIDLLTIIKEV